MGEVSIYNPEDDGYQFVYIDKQFSNAFHFSGNQLGEAAVEVLECLGHAVNELRHSDLSAVDREFLLENDYNLDGE